ncbi:MAG: peptide chain release factor N(5)-glutamine methyltransferase [Bacteroidales bacterium]|nr:peptide chain release factor N(5)-glutamine methyltransferase [Bacteroidales bacterium]
MKTKSNKILDVKDYIRNELQKKYTKEEISALINILFEEYAGLNSAHTLAFGDEPLNESVLLKIVLATEQLKKEKPIQQITGKAEFWDLVLRVNEHVLLPRPETEELCRMAAAENPQKNLKVMDLCTGSACIALSLKKHLNQAEVYAVDISEKALEIAKENSQNLGLEVHFIKADILKDFSCEENFDIIISNPPYIMPEEKSLMQKNVLDYEPHIALFADGEKPLLFYEKIARFAEKHLKEGGKMYLEINPLLANETLSLFSEKEYFRDLRKDLFDKERIIFLKKKTKNICQ